MELSLFAGLSTPGRVTSHPVNNSLYLEMQHKPHIRMNDIQTTVPWMGSRCQKLLTAGSLQWYWDYKSVQHAESEYIWGARSMLRCVASINCIPLNVFLPHLTSGFSNLLKAVASATNAGPEVVRAICWAVSCLSQNNLTNLNIIRELGACGGSRVNDLCAPSKL